MRRRAALVAIVTTALVCVSADLGACGDKYLRAGHSARLRGWATIHPGSILIYEPIVPNAKGLELLRQTLKRAGHSRVEIIRHGTPLAPLLAKTKVDLVISLHADAIALKDLLCTLPSAPDAIPILKDANKAIIAQAEKEFQSVISLPMDVYDVVRKIEHAMARREKALNATSSRK